MAHPQPDRAATSALRRAAAAAVGNGLLAGWVLDTGDAPGGAPAHLPAHPPAAPRDQTKPRPMSVKPLRPRQLTAARLLLEGLSMKEVARRLGVHPATLTRWSVDPRFQAEVRRQADRAPTKGHIPPQNRASAPRSPDRTNPLQVTPAEQLLRALGLDGSS